MKFFTDLIGHVGSALRIKSAPSQHIPAARVAEQPDAAELGAADAPDAPAVAGE